jgi:prepilin signal peptidase PulO-like enzyme (type II secretory pathway)
MFIYAYIWIILMFLNIDFQYNKIPVHLTQLFYKVLSISYYLTLLNYVNYVSNN